MSPGSGDATSEGKNREDVLVDIALRGERAEASFACSGLGLCLAGVGYDLADLALDKTKTRGSRQQAQSSEKKKSRKDVEGVFSPNADDSVEMVVESSDNGV